MTVKEARAQLEKWVDEELDKVDNPDRKPRVHFFSKAAAHKAVLQMLEQKDDQLSASIITALTIALSSSTKAERLDNLIDDYASEPDVIGWSISFHHQPIVCARCRRNTSIQALCSMCKTK